MDKAAWADQFTCGAEALKLPHSEALIEALWRYSETLLKWNKKLNLTAIENPAEVLEKHMLDSLAVQPFLGGAHTLFDVGAGAGFPGVVLGLADAGLSVLAVDAVSKKVQFIKQVIAELRLAPRVQAKHLRVTGDAAADGVQLFDAAICRALMELEPWCDLANSYVAPGGRVMAMVGKAPEPSRLEALQAKHGYREVTLHRYALPSSGAERAIVVLTR